MMRYSFYYCYNRFFSVQRELKQRQDNLTLYKIKINGQAHYNNKHYAKCKEVGWAGENVC